MALNCNQGITIPQLTLDPCRGKTIPASCVIDSTIYQNLGLSANATQQQINQAVYLALINLQQLSPAYKTLVVNVTQTLTNPPVVTTLVNTTGKIFTPYYQVTGAFGLSPNVAYGSSAKFEIFSNNLETDNTDIKFFKSGDNFVIRTYLSNTLTNGLLNNTTLRFNVYE